MLKELFYSGFLQDGEEIYLVVHRHFFLTFKKLFRDIFFGLFLPFVMWFLFPETVIVAGAWGWLGVLRIVYDLIDWYYDAWLVTNISIIQVEWNGFFKKSATRTEYHYIESVGYEVKGFWATLCGYGTITAEKVTGTTLTFHGAAFPKGKVEKMLQFQDNFVTKKNIRDHRTLKGILTDLLSQHFAEHGFPDVKKNKP